MQCVETRRVGDTSKMIQKSCSQDASMTHRCVLGCLHLFDSNSASTFSFSDIARSLLTTAGILRLDVMTVKDATQDAVKASAVVLQAARCNECRMLTDPKAIASNLCVSNHAEDLYKARQKATVSTQIFFDIGNAQGEGRLSATSKMIPRPAFDQSVRSLNDTLHNGDEP